MCYGVCPALRIMVHSPNHTNPLSAYQINLYSSVHVRESSRASGTVMDELPSPRSVYFARRILIFETVRGYVQLACLIHLLRVSPGRVSHSSRGWLINRADSSHFFPVSWPAHFGPFFPRPLDRAVSPEATKVIPPGVSSVRSLYRIARGSLPSSSSTRRKPPPLEPPTKLHRPNIT